jgi:hypothetical protein
MNIIGHIAVGMVGYVITKEHLFIVGSLLPDIALIPNELRFKRFNKWDFKFYGLYVFTHSLIFPALLYFVQPYLALSSLIHILSDVPFHTSRLRWRPFLINRYKPKKKALLLSGGMDSIACAVIERDFDCVYFNYGQTYHELEYPHAKRMADTLNKQLIVIEKDWHTDIQNRNYYFIAELKRMGYDEVIIGTRNIFPVFDRYKDSNWFNLKLYQYLIGIYINMPLTGKFKWQVKKILSDSYSYYSTENNFKQNYALH